MTMRLTDLHAHLVPGVDDGPSGWEETSDLLADFVRTTEPPAVVAATPHASLTGHGRAPVGRERRIAEFVSLAGRILPDGFRLLCGAEVMLDRMPSASAAAGIQRYPGTDWVLAELPPTTPWLLARMRLASLAGRVRGVVLAHPERYGWCREKPGRLEALAGLGVWGQVSGRSLVRGSRDTRDAAIEIIRRGLCRILASDCHHRGDPSLSSLRDEVAGACGDESWARMVSINPALVLGNADPKTAEGRG